MEINIKTIIAGVLVVVVASLILGYLNFWLGNKDHLEF